MLRYRKIKVEDGEWKSGRDTVVLTGSKRIDLVNKQSRVLEVGIVKETDITEECK